MGRSRTSIILSASSDIGAELARRRLAAGGRVFGTYRQDGRNVESLRTLGASLFVADFSRGESVKSACELIAAQAAPWDELIVAPGTLEPIGLFEELDFDRWSSSFNVNFFNPLRAVQALLPGRLPGAAVVFFAGGGTNGAADRFSAYTASKIALIKMTELLHSEIEDARFVILGPGWIRTKIHEETLRAGDAAGASCAETRRRLEAGDFGSMASVLDCIDWTLQQPRSVVGGRNLSVQHDNWSSEALAGILEADANAGKLRRHGNATMATDTTPRNKHPGIER
ncbi:MAG: SDR family NAD(P)-dependent oxidoreductase [Gammaproteobacteria bacterium]